VDIITHPTEMVDTFVDVSRSSFSQDNGIASAVQRRAITTLIVEGEEVHCMFICQTRGVFGSNGVWGGFRRVGGEGKDGTGMHGRGSMVKKT